MGWHRLEPVDDAFFDTAPHRYHFPIDLPVSPERVWEQITSDASLSAWGPGTSAVRWTSSRPFGVGTTRTVRLIAHTATVRERFIVWDEGTRYTFQVEEINRPGLHRIGEDYRLSATPTGCRLDWRIGVEGSKRGAGFVALSSSANRLAFAMTARDAKRYFVRHPT